MDQAALRKHLKGLIIRVCDVKNVQPEQVDDEAILFAPDGPLDLTSLDAIEIAIAIEREYKVKMMNVSSARDCFRSVATLANHIAGVAGPELQERFKAGAQG
jgi:acyl carrier protein